MIIEIANISRDFRCDLEENWKSIETAIEECAERGIEVIPTTVFSREHGGIVGWLLHGWEPPPGQIIWSNDWMTPENVKNLELYAWVGEDEFGSGEIGIKQALVPAGCIPLVAIKKDSMDSAYIIQQLQKQAGMYNKNIRLIKLSFVEELITIEAKKDEAEKD